MKKIIEKFDIFIIKFALKRIFNLGLKWDDDEKADKYGIYQVVDSDLGDTVNIVVNPLLYGGKRED